MAISDLDKYLTLPLTPLSENLKFNVKKVYEDYFKISNNVSVSSNSEIWIAYKLISNNIDNLFKNQFNKDYKLILKALDKFRIVSIELDVNGDTNIQQIFESINSTWKQLTFADLIRNLILMADDKKSQNFIYEKYRKNIENLLFCNNKNIIESFFSDFVSIKKRLTTTNSKVYEEFRKEYLSIKMIKKNCINILRI